MDKGKQVQENNATKKSEMARGDESLAPALQDEVVDLEHLLVEFESDHVSVDGAFCSDQDKLGKNSELDDFFIGIENFQANYGGLSLDDILNEEDEFDELLNGFLQFDEVGTDAEHAGKVSAFDNRLTEESCLHNSTPDSDSTCISRSNNVASGITVSLSMGTSTECESSDKMIMDDMHGRPRIEYGYQLPAEDNYNDNCPKSLLNESNKLGGWLNSTDEIKFDENYKCSNLSKMQVCNDGDGDCNCLFSSTFSPCKKRATSFVLGTEVERFCKPTQWFMEEASELEYPHHVGGNENSVGPLEAKHLNVKSSDHHDKTFSEAHPNSSCTQGHMVRHANEMSSDDYEKKHRVAVERRRRDHIWWSDSEVSILLDGITKYGVGKWTDIHRLLFSTSAHRTPIDLRDKWRNLLQSFVPRKKHKRGKVTSKNLPRCLPEALIRRIRELAKTHPYTNKRGLKR